MHIALPIIPEILTRSFELFATAAKFNARAMLLKE
jgi:hypothetical protein